MRLPQKKPATKRTSPSPRKVTFSEQFDMGLVQFDPLNNILELLVYSQCAQDAGDNT